MTATFKRGDSVWFISKFGDRVAGKYEGPHETEPGCIVISDNAFGPRSKIKGVRCLIAEEALHKESKK